jgi:hypothetical protein
MSYYFAKTLDIGFDQAVRHTTERRTDTMRRALALTGFFFLFIVILTHVAEHWHIVPSMGWGLPDSPGHYLDLTSAILGVGLLLAGLFWRKG